MACSKGAESRDKRLLLVRFRVRGSGSFSSKSRTLGRGSININQIYNTMLSVNNSYKQIITTNNQ